MNRSTSLEIHRSLSPFMLGALIAFFWSFQHILQGPLYKTVGTDIYGVLECILLTELVVFPFLALCLFLPAVRAGIKDVLNSSRYLSGFAVAGSLSMISLIFYAVGQSKVDGVDVSILLNLSPLAAIVANYYFHRDESGLSGTDSIVRAVLSTEFAIHFGLGAIIILLYRLAPENEFSFSTLANARWSLLLLLVPVFYFISGEYIRKRFGAGRDYRPHFAAIVLIGCLVTSVSAIAIAIILSLSQHEFMIPNQAAADIVAFCTGSFVSSFLGGTVFLALYLRSDREAQPEIRLSWHLVPAFSVLVAYGAIYITGWDLTPPSKVQLYSVLLVVTVLYLYYKRAAANS